MVPGEISHGVSSGFSSRISLSLDFFWDSFQCFLLPPGISPKYFFFIFVGFLPEDFCKSFSRDFPTASWKISAGLPSETCAEVYPKISPGISPRISCTVLLGSLAELLPRFNPCVSPESLINHLPGFLDDHRKEF